MSEKKAFIVPPDHETLTEGSATIIYNTKNQVFYNKVQIFNRDLSCLIAKMCIQQQRAEVMDRAARREAKVPWRKSPPTWNHWNATIHPPKNVAATTSSSTTNTTSATSSATTSSSSTTSSSTTTTTTPTTTNYLDPSTDWEAEVTKNLDENGAFVLEALSATGLRSIRYINEVPGIKTLLVNDLEEAAVEAIQRNIEFNGESAKRCVSNHGDANMVMHQHRGEGKLFDVIDLYPYGTAAPFLDAAMQSVQDGGLLCVTCTDLAVLCGNQRDVCYAKYGSIPTKAPYCHEMAVRMVLAMMDRVGAKYKRYIVPLFCARIDFYVRLFVRVYTSPAEIKKVASKISMVHQCVNCDAFYLRPVAEISGNKCRPGRALPNVHPTCAECGGAFAIGGPIWNRPIINPAFCKEILSRLDKKQLASGRNPHLTTVPRIRGEIAKALGEVSNAPLFYSMSSLAKRLRCQVVPIANMMAAIQSCGYSVSQAAAADDSLKTDAPPNVVWDIMRRWVELHPISKNRQKETDSIGFRLLSKKPTITCDFKTAVAGIKRSRATEREQFVRYAPNPEANWGPKRRATGKKIQKNEE
jgi:tRNA (guanine26-N2/guanine27-N2)-dimethyltransferase